jgi:hypothetical protein
LVSWLLDRNYRVSTTTAYVYSSFCGARRIIEDSTEEFGTGPAELLAVDFL